MHLSFSSSNSSTRWIYDVFLSFRGKDTRKNFTDHLYHALVRAGIHTFRDDDEIESGGEIGPECLKAIQGSRFSIVILSSGYATSTWCLDELAHIVECRRTLGQIVWPIFYDVDPTHVEELRGSFGEAFEEHHKKYEKDLVEKWKAALKEVVYLKGLDLPNHADGHEAKNIDEIVKKISSKLSRTKLNVAIHPVDLDSRAHEVISLLALESTDVRMVGIFGMGGIGKTCIAKEVFNQVFDKFEGSCFLESVKQKFDDVKGITNLQRQLLSETLARKHEKIESIDRGLNIIQERLRHRRVLIVLDDIDKINQITKILGSHNWLSPGSRVIITTRIKDLLQPSARYQQYEVKELDDCQSLQLLSLHAFDKGDPSEDYIDCATRLVHYAGGVPLALEVLGSSLRGEGIDVWNRRLNKLKVISHEDIHSKLELSYDALDDSEKSLFLDIACFFIGKRKNFVISILDDLDSFPTDGISSLMKRCLVKVDSDNKLLMHDLIRDMGREVVRREFPKNPGKRSRLWRCEDVIDVLNYETGTDFVEGLVIDLPKLKHSPNSEAFKEMKQLRLLKLNYVHLTGNYMHISKRLRWLCWFEFPLPSIPNELYLQNLVSLDLRYSHLKTFSDESKSLAKLKFLNLSYSRDLTNTPNFEGFCSLVKLVLKGCTSLAEVHNSIGDVTGLNLLNLQNCKSLKTLPASVCSLQSLEKLNISGCSSLQQLPEDLGNLKSLVELLADGAAISTIPESIGNLKELRSLSLQECPLIFSPKRCSQYILSFLPSSLKILNLGYCNIIEDMIPHHLEGLILLEDLKLCGNNFTSFPVGMSKLPKLHTLWLDECKRLQSIPQLQSSIRSLHAKDCPSLVSINLVNFRGEADLEVSGCPNLKEVKGFFSLETLSVDALEKLLKAEGSFAQDSVAGVHVRVIDNLTQTYVTTPLQALSERGAYSIFLPGNEVPEWFSYQREDDTVSFRIPGHKQGTEIIGFATCVIYAWTKPHEACFFNPHITIINATKKFHWLYTPYITFFCSQVEQDIMWLCYWMFDNQLGANDDMDLSWRFKDETEEGDEVEFIVDMGFGIEIKKCAIHPLYLQPSQPNDLALVSYASARHEKRFQKSRAKWLSFEDREKIKPQEYYERSPDKGYKEYWDWDKQRSKKVNQSPDVYTYTPSSKKSTNLMNFLKAISEENPTGSSSNAKSKAVIEEEKIVIVPPEIISANVAQILPKIPTSQEAPSGSNTSESTSNLILFERKKTESTIPNVHVKSRNLLAELANRHKKSPVTGETSSSSNSSLVVPIDIIQQQRKSLANFLNMSVEDIQEANAFEDMKRTAHTLIQFTTDTMEKTIVEDLMARLEEFKDNIPSAMEMAEAARAHRESLQERTKQVNAKLQKIQVLLTSLEAEFSRLSEEEMQVEAEIQRLMSRKMELHSLKDSVGLELEKTNEETSKDLEEWENLDAESKQADHTWLQANQKLADANTFFKLVKAKLTL